MLQVKAKSRNESRASRTLADPRWARVVARDPEADGQFYYSVRTTGVYCRPSCGARRARPENVDFHASPAAAEAAGFRPCKRCRPSGPPAASTEARQAQMIARAVQLLETSEEAPDLKSLAEAAGVSPYHFHRVFKARTGLTPAAYARAHRAQRMEQALAGQQSVTDAIFEAGYGSSSRFYEQSNARLGMTPGKYREGGPGAEIRFAIGACSLGAVLVACSQRGVCAILLGDDPEELALDLQKRFSQAARLIGDDPAFAKLVAKIVGYIEDPNRSLDPKIALDVRGTAFQQRVWAALQEIPPGETRSYSELAAQIGTPGGARAVARACAANHLAVAVPCHRVIQRDGGLSGYRWGVERKRTLLERESPAGSQTSARRTPMRTPLRKTKRGAR